MPRGERGPELVRDAGTLVGTISGDIEGTVVTIGGPAVEHGVVVSRPVRQTRPITGGIVEPLIGRTLAIEGDFLGITAHLPVLRVNTRARTVEGAQRGNLTYHGTTDLSAFPLVTSELTYHGVICP